MMSKANYLAKNLIDGLEKAESDGERDRLIAFTWDMLHDTNTDFDVIEGAMQIVYKRFAGLNWGALNGFFDNFDHDPMNDWLEYADLQYDLRS